MVTTVVKFKESESTKAVARGLGDGEWELLFNDCQSGKRVSVWETEKSSGYGW